LYKKATLFSVEKNIPIIIPSGWCIQIKWHGIHGEHTKQQIYLGGDFYSTEKNKRLIIVFCLKIAYFCGEIDLI
jgi:hypothetical protein